MSGLTVARKKFERTTDLGIACPYNPVIAERLNEPVLLRRGPNGLIVIVLSVIDSVGYLGRGRAKRNNGICAVGRSLLGAYTGLHMGNVS